ncbi:hypothetical protein FS837_011640, partial [Tulasnella sp. UAMH 9824]
TPPVSSTSLNEYRSPCPGRTLDIQPPDPRQRQSDREIEAQSAANARLPDTLLTPRVLDFYNWPHRVKTTFANFWAHRLEPGCLLNLLDMNAFLRGNDPYWIRAAYDDSQAIVLWM